MKQRFYFDTSVFGGVYDKEFEQESLPLFERVLWGEVIILYTELVETELVNAPKKVIDFFKNIPDDSLEKVPINDDVIKLATKYIEEKVVGETSLDDCLHIAAATVTKRIFL